MARSPYSIRYAPDALDDIRSLRAFDQRKIVDGIERHLLHQPTHVSRTSIKRMVQPFWSQYRLRIEDFRVYYDVDETTLVLDILRILKKEQEPTVEDPSHETD